MENQANGCGDPLNWSLESLRNMNAEIVRYSDLDEHSVVGGQGECKKAVAHFLAKSEKEGIAQQQKVAIKRLLHAFGNANDAKYAYRELMLLSLVQHPNLIQLMDVLVPAQLSRTDPQLFLVTRDGGETLHTQMRRRNLCGQRWAHNEVASIAYQVLCGLNHLHTAGIVHRDLKVNNIVVDERRHVRILDFGCGRSVYAGSAKMTPNVMVPFYRAPEIFLGFNAYDTKVDIWSAGCIIVELLIGKRLFNGTDFERQWPKFVAVLGSPTLEDFVVHHQIQPSHRRTIQSVGQVDPLGWHVLLPDTLFGPSNNVEGLTAEHARDVLSRMLVFNPSERISAADALQHPYFAGFFDESALSPLNPFHYEFSDETAVHSVEQWTEKILQRIGQFEAEASV